METDQGLGPERVREHAAQQHRDILEMFGSITVGQVVGPGLGNKLLFTVSLREAAVALVDSGRSAVAVADRYGCLVGLLTENDVMRCFFEDVDPFLPLDEWLASGMARAPLEFFQRISVSLDDNLSTVVARMVRNFVAGDCACHHVLVREDFVGVSGRCAVLESLDIVQALHQPRMWGKPTLQQFAAETTVEEVMKPRESVFTCPPSDSMKDVLRLLLMTQQNCVMVVDEDGVYGIVTPRNVVRAFAEGVRADVRIMDWLRGLETRINSRIVATSATIGEAAALMVARNLHHLVVTRPGTPTAVGVVSSLDIAFYSCHRAIPELWRARVQREAGPTVGEVVAEDWHSHAVCDRGATLAEAAAFLLGSGRTSAAVALCDDATPLGLLTDVDLMRAYVNCWPRDCTVERWLLVNESSRPAILPPLLVTPSTRLTEAATLMFRVGRGGREPCEHLVVKGAGFGWVGIFSALDVARALCSLGSELDVSKVGVDQLKVSAVMKPAETVPVCSVHACLREAFTLMMGSFQHALLVVRDDGSFRGLLTTRCALSALAEEVSAETSVEAWLASHPQGDMPRAISPDAPLMEAAIMMVERGLHHLIVKEPDSASLPIGVLSALDVVRGVASARATDPFTSLCWLWSRWGPSSCALWPA